MSQSLVSDTSRYIEPVEAVVTAVNRCIPDHEAVALWRPTEWPDGDTYGLTPGRSPEGFW